jgi:hypothetical protein
MAVDRGLETHVVGYTDLGSTVTECGVGMCAWGGVKGLRRMPNG